MDCDHLHSNAPLAEDESAIDYAAAATSVGKSRRGRLKKLLGRAAIPRTGGYDGDGDGEGDGGGGEVGKKKKKKSHKGNGLGRSGRGRGASSSGIICREDYRELLEIMRERNDDRCSEVGPSVLTAAGGRSFGEAAVAAATGPSAEDGGDNNGMDGWRLRCEMADHRDLVLNLLLRDWSGGEDGRGGQQQAKKGKRGKKRRRSESAAPPADGASGDFDGGGEGTDSVADASVGRLPPIPGWARVHNPATLGGLAVVEFSVEGSSEGGGFESDSASLRCMPSHVMGKNYFEGGGAAGDANNNGYGGGDDDRRDRWDKEEGLTTKSVFRSLLSPSGLNGRRALPVRTRAFQGPNPKSITEGLLYSDPPPPPKRKLPMPADVPRTEDMVEMLGRLALTRKQMRKEGYPRVPRRDPVKEAKKAMKKSDGGRGKAGKLTKEEDDKVAARNEVLRLAKRVWEEADQTSSSLLASISANEALELIRRLAEREVVDGLPSEGPEDGDGSGSSNSSDSVSTKGDGSGGREVFVSTFASSARPSYGGGRERRVFAVDCEMVRTSSARPELARVTLLQHAPTPSNPERYVVEFDEVVKPRRPVLDYLTQYSGMTAKAMEGVEVRIEHIQAAMLTLVDAEDVLVGHSAENDLRALRIVHDRVVDTSVLFRNAEGRKFSLRHLSAVLLRRQIQHQGSSASATSSAASSSTAGGHCSEEDAAAALSLAVRRALLGPDFCLQEKLRKTSILQAVSSAKRRAVRSASGGKNPMSSSFITREGSMAATACVGPTDWLREHVAGEGAAGRTDAHALTCESSRSDAVGAILAWLRSKERRAGLLWANLIVQVDGKQKGGCRQRIDKIVSELIESVPGNVVLLLVFQRDFGRAGALSKERRVGTNPRCTIPWSNEKEEEYSRSVEACRWCDVLWVGMSS